MNLHNFSSCQMETIPFNMNAPALTHFSAITLLLSVSVTLPALGASWVDRYNICIL